MNAKKSVPKGIRSRPGKRLAMVALCFTLLSPPAFGRSLHGVAHRRPLAPEKIAERECVANEESYCGHWAHAPAGGSEAFRDALASIGVNDEVKFKGTKGGELSLNPSNVWAPATVISPRGGKVEISVNAAIYVRKTPKGIVIQSTEEDDAWMKLSDGSERSVRQVKTRTIEIEKFGRDHFRVTFRYERHPRLFSAGNLWNGFWSPELTTSLMTNKPSVAGGTPPHQSEEGTFYVKKVNWK